MISPLSRTRLRSTTLSMPAMSRSWRGSRSARNSSLCRPGRITRSLPTHRLRMDLVMRRPNGLHTPDGLHILDGWRILDGLHSPDGLHMPDSLHMPDDGLRITSRLPVRVGLGPRATVLFELCTETDFVAVVRTVPLYASNNFFFVFFTFFAITHIWVTSLAGGIMLWLAGEDRSLRNRLRSSWLMSSTVEAIVKRGMTTNLCLAGDWLSQGILEFSA